MRPAACGLRTISATTPGAEDDEWFTRVVMQLQHNAPLGGHRVSAIHTSRRSEPHNANSPAAVATGLSITSGEGGI